MKKLLAYPIPTARLFWIEVMLRVTTGIEMLLILTAGAIGLILNPRFGGWTKAPRIIAPLLVFVVFNLLLASGIRGLIERLLSRRHLREIFVAVIVMLSALPQLLVVTGVPRGALQRLISPGFERHLALDRGSPHSLVWFLCRAVGGAAGLDGRRLFVRTLAI